MTLRTAVAGALLAASRPSGYNESLDWVGDFGSWGFVQHMHGDW